MDGNECASVNIESCGFCKKTAVNKKVNCVNCLSVFHISCYKKTKNKKCCDKPNYVIGNQVEDEAEEDILNDNLLEKATDWENQLLKELNRELKENNKLLREKIENLEKRNTDLEKLLLDPNKGQQNKTEDHLNIIIEDLKYDFHTRFKILTDDITKLKQQFKKAGEIEVNIKTGKGQKKNLQEQQITEQVNKPVTTKLFSDALKTVSKQNNLDILEKQQRNLMNDLINLEPKAGTSTGIQTASIQVQPTSEKKNWETVRSKRKSYKKTLGQAEDTNGTFKGENPKVWMYLDRVTQDVTEDDIKKYLESKTGSKNEEFIVKNMKTTGSRFKSFMVAADFKFKEEFYKPSFWPKGVGYRRFDFKLYYGKYQIKDVNRDADLQQNSFLEIQNHAQQN